MEFAVEVEFAVYVDTDSDDIHEVAVTGISTPTRLSSGTLLRMAEAALERARARSPNAGA